MMIGRGRLPPTESAVLMLLLSELVLYDDFLA